ncbi:uncharacterized protein LOC127702979 [Mytilus californianus]|uniref:uncharacterized protein LOC127702979 n=1 Tax=Mytilus californianus TaxID=6549 RepID=UPI0022475804|nr:uncharacterized protein LOC127702979 [Mytilus californianus]
MKDLILMMAIYSTLGMVNAGVTLTLETQTIKMGESLILTCTVHGISKINPDVTRQFAKGSNGDLLCYNGHITQTKKYEEILSDGNEFRLRIKNVTESDVNSIYQCRYRFFTVKQMIGINEMNFEYGPTENTTYIEFNNYDNTSFEIQINFTKIFPLPMCSAQTKNSKMQFKNTSIMEERIFYKVSFILVYVDGDQCGTDLEIYCKVGRSNYPIETFKPFMECPCTVPMFIILTICGVLLIGSISSMALLIVYKKRRKRKLCTKSKNKSKTKTDIDNADEETFL